MACLQHVRKAWAASLNGGHDSTVLSGMEVLDARPGYVKCGMVVQKHNLNSHGSMHGGCVMTLVDTVTWLSLATLGDPVSDSVTTNMSSEFVRPCGREGDYLYAEGFAVQQGRRLAFTRVTFTLNDKVTGFGSHTLAMVPAETGPRYKFSADGATRIPVQGAKL